MEFVFERLKSLVVGVVMLICAYIIALGLLGESFCCSKESGECLYKTTENFKPITVVKDKFKLSSFVGAEYFHYVTKYKRKGHTVKKDEYTVRFKTKEGGYVRAPFELADQEKAVEEAKRFNEFLKDGSAKEYNLGAVARDSKKILFAILFALGGLYFIYRDLKALFCRAKR
ncbi:MAG: hypothetical protein LBL47_01285 [Lactobacillus sp.]|jgi:hypothetical protein|nr:hypothetical protein [Lactobacillus sp.]